MGNIATSVSKIDTERPLHSHDGPVVLVAKQGVTDELVTNYYLLKPLFRSAPFKYCLCQNRSLVRWYIQLKLAIGYIKGSLPRFFFFGPRKMSERKYNKWCIWLAMCCWWWRWVMSLWQLNAASTLISCAIQS